LILPNALKITRFRIANPKQALEQNEQTKIIPIGAGLDPNTNPILVVGRNSIYSRLNGGEVAMARLIDGECLIRQLPVADLHIILAIC
jgi:hypothetical protein